MLFERIDEIVLTKTKTSMSKQGHGVRKYFATKQPPSTPPKVNILLVFIFTKECLDPCAIHS